MLDSQRLRCMCMRMRIVVILLVAGCLAGGRLGAAVITVACVGDSITAGAGASDAAHVYPEVLGHLLGSGYAVRNFGHSGATLLRSGDLPYWSVGEFAGSDGSAPDIVVIMLGTNDSKPQNWTSFSGQFAGDYADLIDHYRALPSRPLVFCCRVCPVYGVGNFGITSPIVQDGVLPEIDRVAAAKAAPVIDVNTALSGLPLDFPDRVHPNDDGYALLARTVYASIHPPAAVIGLSALAVSATRIDLSWTDAADNETGFTIARATTPGGPFTVIATAPAGATAFSDAGLAVGTRYFYRVLATNAAGDAATAGVADATTLPPPPAFSAPPFSASSGAVGGVTILVGVHFTGATAVAFNGVGASFTVVADGAISVVIPPGATTGPVTVTTPGGAATSTVAFTVTSPAGTSPGSSSPAGASGASRGCGGGGFSAALVLLALMGMRRSRRGLG